jgi:hypothetical protein
MCVVSLLGLLDEDLPRHRRRQGDGALAQDWYDVRKAAAAWAAA